MDQDTDVRYIQNVFPQYQESSFNLEETRKKTLHLLVKSIADFYKVIKVGEIKAIAVRKSKSQPDFSLFDGAGSYLITYVKLYQFFRRIAKGDLEYLQQNISEEYKQYLNIEKYQNDIVQQIKCLEQQIGEQNSSKPDITFFFSPIGVYLVSMIFYADINNKVAFDNNLNKILQVTNFIAQNQKNPSLYHELLYGTSGYLYNLLFIQKHFLKLLDANQKNELEVAISKVFIIIIQSGYTMKEDDPEFRLRYHFHKKEYLGGAHGLFGISYILMTTIQQNPQLKQVYNQDIESLILKSIKFCQALQLNTGNFPTGTHKLEVDYLVQFCHGSPGAIVPLILASQIFNDQTLLESSKQAGENIWKYGILKKGYGLCHGISGNAYPFFTLYNATKDQKWLYYGFTFILAQQNQQVMDIIKNYDLPDRYAVGSSDYPYSYMMGLSGDISLIVDSLQPDFSLFLGYEI